MHSTKNILFLRRSSPWAAAAPPLCTRPGWFVWRLPVGQLGCAAPCSPGSGYWSPSLQWVSIKWNFKIWEDRSSSLQSLQLTGWSDLGLCGIRCSHPALTVAGSGPAQATALWCHRHLLALAEWIQNRHSSAWTHTPTYTPQAHIKHLSQRMKIKQVKHDAMYYVHNSNIQSWKL